MDDDLRLAIEASMMFKDLDDEDDLELVIEESKMLYAIHKKDIIEELLNKDEKTINEKVFTIGFSKLNEFQKDIFYECIDRKIAGLALPLGTGKTLISLTLGLYFTITGNPLLIVASKSLITNWGNRN